ncbi:branched-chain amino acid ABC transporter permease [Paraburkholderia lycopersici]|uniref:Branched-chain amino acid transport system permease protein n=1 Tax=Paraburkholderia lycopersici TaxID=416944 RepID=A0A1G6QBN6_9BURK|nr:branched-chain amino acid ABC transporter permease [Paraburkholderia lycopersici]SDC89728.1 branched-chain amino acid transport system permease protein [Paraburkholderia lycopersici]
MASLISHAPGATLRKSAGRIGAARTSAAVALALLVLAVPSAFGGYGLYVAASGAMMAVGAMALTVLSGSAGLPSLGTAAFLAIGAFTSGILATQWGLGLVPAVVVAVLFGFAAGTTIALLTLRVSGLYLAVGTLALQHVVQIVATDLDLKLTYASGFMLDSPRIAGWAVDTPLRWWALTAALVALVYALFSWLQRGHVGREWALLRVEPDAAAALGVSAVRTRLAVFALTSAVIAAAGAVDGYRLGNVQASTYTLHLAITYLTVAALGGAGRLVGAIVASYVIVVLPDAIAALLGVAGIDATSHGAGIDNMLIGAILAFALLDGPARVRRAIVSRGVARRTAARQEAR